MNIFRLNAVQQEMHKMRINQTVITDSHALTYLTGRTVHHVGERLLALYIPATGRPSLHVNALFPIPQDDDLDIIYHRDGEVATASLAKVVAPGAIGIDDALPAKFLIDLLAARQGIALIHGSAPINAVRSIKLPAEIAALRESSAISDAVFAKIPSLIKAGMTENQLAAAISAEFARLDSPSTPLICFGENAAEPHHGNDDTVLKHGDAIIVDGGIKTRAGYCSDMTRTFFYKTATDEMRKIYKIVHIAHNAAKSAARPGVTCASVDAAARVVIDASGYGRFFTHRTGHGIGLTGHESPFICADDQTILAPGMSFTVEPGIYIPGKFGVRIEDVVIITDSGCESLNDCSQEFTIVD